MHRNVLIHEQAFLETYFPNSKNLHIAEIGSLNVNGSLKEEALRYSEEYIGIDFASGKDVDVVIEDPYSLPFPDNKFDLVMSSSCFEHSEMFWLSFLESLRILKPTGLLWYTVPGAWMSYHQYPVDCWRFYPDSAIALEKWANRSKIHAKMLESYMTIPSALGECSDAVAIFIKDFEFENQFLTRVITSNKVPFVNGHLNSGNTYPINPAPLDYNYMYYNYDGV